MTPAEEIDDPNLSPEMRAAVARGRELHPDGYPVALILAGQPLATAGEAMAAMSLALENEGYRAVLLEVTGAGVVWAIPARPDDDQGSGS